MKKKKLKLVKKSNVVDIKKVAAAQGPTPMEIRKAQLNAFLRVVDDPQLKGFVVVKIKTTGEFTTHLDNVNAQELTFAHALLNKCILETLAASQPQAPLPPT